MNLVKLFQGLTLPENESARFLNAKPIPEYPKFRVAIDIHGYPILLLPIFGTTNTSRLKNHRLKYLQFEPKANCKISEGISTSFQQFALITFTSDDKELQEYFLHISENLVRSLHGKSNYQEIIETLNKYIEVFRALTDPPTNTAQGLWAELFLIESSIDPKILLSFWHNFPDEKFDFSAGREKIEVKSTSGSERIHEFSSEQLSPPLDIQVLVASLFTSQNNSGKSIQDLMRSISSRIQDDGNLLEKMNLVVSKTLGNSLEQSVKIKFDYEVSKSSLRFYKHQDISKVEKVYIPAEVSGVRYRSDLSLLKPLDLSTLETEGTLFRGICA
jgi:hypothetical protein